MNVRTLLLGCIAIIAGNAASGCEQWDGLPFEERETGAASIHLSSNCYALVATTSYVHAQVRDAVGHGLNSIGVEWRTSGDVPIESQEDSTRTHELGGMNVPGVSRLVLTAGTGATGTITVWPKGNPSLSADAAVQGSCD